MIVTTDAGLYRYFMNDLIEVTGRFHATPTIQFVQKGSGVTSIAGEKLYEYDAKRKSGRLLTVAIGPVIAGTGEAYKRHMLKQGRRESQFKLLPLQYAADCTFDFSSARLPPDPA